MHAQTYSIANSIGSGNSFQVCQQISYTLKIDDDVTTPRGEVYLRATTDDILINGLPGLTNPVCATFVGGTYDLAVEVLTTGGTYGIEVFEKNSGSCTPILPAITTVTLAVQTGTVIALDDTYNACEGLSFILNDVSIQNRCSGDCSIVPVTGYTPPTFEWSITASSRVVDVANPIDFSGAPIIALPAIISNAKDYTLDPNLINSIRSDENITVRVSTIKSYASGLSCNYIDETVITAREVPTLTNIALGTPTNTNTTLAGADGLCINGENTYSTTCSGGCPTVSPGSTANDTYKWKLEDLNAVSTFADEGGTLATNTNSIDIVPLNILGTGSPIAPKDYVLTVEAINVHGCQDSKTQSITVRDIPAVEAEVESDPGTGTFSPVNLTATDLCTGTNLQLRLRGCASTSYSAVTAANNNSSTPADPNTSSDYADPCDNTGNYFHTITWRAEGDNTTSIPIAAPSGSLVTTPVVLSTPSSAADNTVTSRASMIGDTGPGGRNLSKYFVTALAYNGCSNTDEIRIRVKDPEITFAVDATTGIASGGPPINGCEGNIPTLTVECPTCLGAITSTLWTPSGAGNVGLTDLTAVSTTLAAGLPPPPHTGRYDVLITDDKGCTNANLTNFISISTISNPSVSGSYPAGLKCTDPGLPLTLTNFNSSNLYEVYTTDPAANPSATPAFSCTGTACGGNPVLVTGLPSGTRTIYLKAIDSGNGCASIGSTTSPVTMTQSPIASAVSIPAEICNNIFYNFRVNGSSAYTYNWTITPGTGAAPGATYPSPIGTPVVRGGFFFSAPEIYYRLNPNYPPQFGVQVTADVTYNGCSTTVDFTPVDIKQCIEPTLQKSANNTPPLSSRDYEFLCEGEELNLAVVYTTGTPTYTPTYLWSTGATTSSINIPTNASTPDSLVHSVKVFDGAIELYELQTVTYISRGPSNFYPAADTTVCLNSQVNAQANCPRCVGNISYDWRSVPLTGGGATRVLGKYGVPDARPWQVYSEVPPTTDDYRIELTLEHGEVCEETHSVVISVNALPSPIITDAVTGNTITGTQYLCDGETRDIEVSCATCSNYMWNNTSTTPIINVSSPGGYYVQSQSANLCSNISNIVLFLPASDGANAVAVANPSEICSNQPVILEVTPCIGCSYTWHDINGPNPLTTPIATGQSYSTNNPSDFYAQVTNLQGCTYQTPIVSLNTTTVTIPSISSTTTSICTGRSSTLRAASLPGATYQWYKDNVQISGAVDSIYVATEAAIYTVRVTYANGCEEESRTVTINDISFNPPITASRNVVCDGTTADLATTLNPVWQYQWYKDGIAITGGNGSLQSVDSTGSYYVRVIDNNLCVENSDTIQITKTNLPIPYTATSTPSICPTEPGVISVSLCSGCEYEWFNVNTSSSITGGPDPTNYRYSFIPSSTGVKSYYAQVSKNGCAVGSDTVSITVQSVFTPSINIVSSVVCNGQNGVLTTQACVGCSYRWLLDSVPALGALNDTFHIVSDTAGVGTYQIAIDYANGCSDTSGIRDITNGSYEVDIATDSGTIICNGVGELITANVTYTGSPVTGVYDYTLFLNNTPVTGATNITSSLTTYKFLGNDKPGAYTVEVVNPNGCRELSNFIFLDTINVIPRITSRATIDPNSIPASAICTPTGGVYLEADVSNCSSCTYQWFKGGTILPGEINKYLSTAVDSAGSAGAGNYIIGVSNQGCTAISNSISIVDAIAGFNNTITPNVASICNGQSTILEYATTNPTCVGCSYRWLRTNNPIGGANNSQYVATTFGDYTLEVTTPLGCVDTSDISVVSSIARPDSFRLQLDTVVSILGTTNSGTGTPIAASATGINLNSWIFPHNVRTDSFSTLTGDSSYFTSTPFNAALDCNGAIPCNPGLSPGGDSSIFTPADSLVGNFLITYHYVESGCEFLAQDILRVLPAATISIANNNPVAVPYEACIGDDLVIRAENLKYRIEDVRVFDDNGVYQTIPTTSLNFTYDTTIYGSDTFYTSTINWTVPGDAYASYLDLRAANPAGQDTILTPFLLIHNTDLSFAGLPNSGELCSNGDRLTLFGNPLGGTFSVRDTLGNVMPGAIVMDSLYPTAINTALYNDSSQLVDVVYSYIETYTNGNNCPNPDFVTQRIKAIDVQLTNVDFNPISVSQDKELLTNLVYRVDPYNARANKQDYYTIGFSGSFTTPAGAPDYFLPSNAGVGRHALTYKITKGTCTNTIEDSIEVVPAPIALALPDTICRDFTPLNFNRHSAFPYSLSFPPPQNSSIIYTDSVHVMRVRGEGVVYGNTNLGLETFTYDPNLVVGSYDTLVIEYIFYRDQDTLSAATGLAAHFDSLEYVVASIIQPIYVEDLLTVDINDTVVQSFYCQDSTLSVLTATPADTFGRGLFMLFGGTGQYQFGDTLFNNIINPYQVNNSENATTTYDLVYILNGVACQNSDTMPITISKGLNPSFVTANGLDEFCETDPAVAILYNVTAPDTAIWKIGGIPQPSYTFDPVPLNAGIHIVDLQQIYTYIQATDTFVCSASATDTFTIHALPNITVLPGLDKQYCANDSIVNFIVSPAPDCPQFGAAGQYVLEENFDAGVPASWVVNTIAGKPWAPDALFPQGGAGLATFVDTSNVVENSWLISPSMNLIAGHTYRLSYMVLAGPADPNCGSGCVASLYVGIGNSSATTAITTQLDYQPLIDNDLAYRRYTVDYFHNPGAGGVTGQFYMGFRNFSPAFGRALRLDNVEMRDLTIDSCRQAGIGFMEGPGVYQVQDSLYQFDPLSVPAGNVTVKYVYTNTMGCQDSVVFPIEVDTAPVVSFTNLDSSYCENEPTVMLTGSPLGGTFTSTRGTNLYDDVNFATLSPAFYPVSYQINTSGVDIVSYVFTDDNNCSETVSDTVVIVELLDRNPIASIDTRGYGYCIIDSANILDVTNIPPLGSGSLITNGTFYGPGVRNGAAGAGVATFHTDSAVIDMGHSGDVTLSYVYTTTTGCLDTTYKTTRVHALPDLSFINLPDSLCLNTDSFQVLVQNRVVTGPLGQTVYIDTIGRQVGQFTETDIFGNPVDDFIQLFDSLYPYEANGYDQINVSYFYITDTLLGACAVTLEDSVRIDSVPVVYFQGLQDYYCENDPISIFLAFPSFNVGSGFLSIDSVQIDSSFYWIDPAIMVGPGQTTAVYPTYYTFTDSRGCRGEAFDTFEVRPFPRITFDPAAQDTFCRQIGQRYDLRQLIVAPLGGFFTDNLALTSIRDSFFLDLGSLPGPRTVTYNYIDPLTLCQNSEAIEIYLFSAPDLDFEVYGGCSQMDITFDGSANNLIAGIDSITQIWWDFEGNGTLTYTQLDTSPITIPDTTYQYSASGTYNVTLYVTNQGACVQSITKPLIISPYYDLATADYIEDFNTGAGDWFDDQPANVTPNNVWTYETSLNGAQINSPDGAWVTIVDSLYAPAQSAWVYSPCFDFTNSIRPMIAFDLWRDLLSGIDGAVLEFYNNSNNTWERVGDVGEGISWYQSDFVLARPGNQATVGFPRGWTGRSNGYESARLRLDQFKGDRDIRFRIAFATSGQTVIDSLSGFGYEGAAFDNVFIGERTRNVLVEHFSNQNYQTLGGLTSDNIDAIVYNSIFNSSYGSDVVLLQYQIDDNNTIGTDPVYQSNSADLGGRSFEYGTQPGEILIDGRMIGTGRSEDLNDWEMDYDMLQFPDFEVRIDQPITIVGNVLTTSATVEALEDKAFDNYVIHTAIMQDSLTFNARSFNMLSIVRKMQPNNAGVNETHDWVIGQTATVAHSWDYTGQLNVASFNPDELEVVVFIQNDRTDEIYQVSTTQDLNRYNGTQTIPTDPRTEIFDLNVYPNPSSDLFNVAFDKALTQAYNWRLVDVTGRTLQAGTAEAGTETFTIDADRLVDGAYFFVINSEDNQVYAQRKLIVIKR